MRVVAGRLAEARVYLSYCLAILKPGVEVPVFAEPLPFVGQLDELNTDDLTLIVDEGRRQFDRQRTDLERMRSRATTLVTIGLAEVGLLAGGARHAFTHGPIPTAAWSISGLLVVLGLAGAVAVLTCQAVLGRTDTAAIAYLPSPLLPLTALAYAQQMSVGEETVRTRLTVLRDAVLLLVLSALIYAAGWPFTN